MYQTQPAPFWASQCNSFCHHPLRGHAQPKVQPLKAHKSPAWPQAASRVSDMAVRLTVLLTLWGQRDKQEARQEGVQCVTVCHVALRRPAHNISKHAWKAAAAPRFAAAAMTHKCAVCKRLQCASPEDPSGQVWRPGKGSKV